jgi:Mg/Co/Ni transporter MgtE
LEEQESQEILKDMQHVPAAEVGELLEYDPDTAGGLMNTQYIAVSDHAHVRDAIEAIRGNEGLLRMLTHVFLIGENDKLVAAVPVGRLFVASPETPLRQLAFRETPKVQVEDDHDRVIEIFDKYNLFALPVVDEEDGLCGVITADDVIAILNPER